MNSIPEPCHAGSQLSHPCTSTNAHPAGTFPIPTADEGSPVQEVTPAGSAGCWGPPRDRPSAVPRPAVGKS